VPPAHAICCACVASASLLWRRRPLFLKQARCVDVSVTTQREWVEQGRAVACGAGGPHDVGVHVPNVRRGADVKVRLRSDDLQRLEVDKPVVAPHHRPALCLARLENVPVSKMCQCPCATTGAGVRRSDCAAGRGGGESFPVRSCSSRLQTTMPRQNARIAGNNFGILATCMRSRPVSEFMSIVFLATSNTATATTLPTDRRRTTNTSRTHALFVRWHGDARETCRARRCFRR